MNMMIKAKANNNPIIPHIQKISMFLEKRSLKIWQWNLWCSLTVLNSKMGLSSKANSEKNWRESILEESFLQTNIIWTQRVNKCKKSKDRFLGIFLFFKKKITISSWLITSLNHTSGKMLRKSFLSLNNLVTFFANKSLINCTVFWENCVTLLFNTETKQIKNWWSQNWENLVIKLPVKMIRIININFLGFNFKNSLKARVKLLLGSYKRKRNTNSLWKRNIAHQVDNSPDLPKRLDCICKGS